MSSAHPAGAEQLLRDLAAGDETVLRSVLDVSRQQLRNPRRCSGSGLAG